MGVAPRLTSCPTQEANKAVYLGGSAKAAVMPSVVQDATTYTPAAQLTADMDDVEDVHMGSTVEAVRVSALMPVATEPTMSRASLFGLSPCTRMKTAVK